MRALQHFCVRCVRCSSLQHSQRRRPPWLCEGLEHFPALPETTRASNLKSDVEKAAVHLSPILRDENWIPSHELGVPLGMSTIYSAVPVDRRMANILLREEPEEEEEDEDEKRDDGDEDENEEDGDGYSE